MAYSIKNGRVQKTISREPPSDFWMRAMFLVSNSENGISKLAKQEDDDSRAAFNAICTAIDEEHEHECCLCSNELPVVKASCWFLAKTKPKVDQPENGILLLSICYECAVGHNSMKSISQAIYKEIATWGLEEVRLS